MAPRRIDIPGSLVLVTGAGSGIGRASALAFARAGARVLAVDIDRQAAEKTAAACAELGVESTAYQADVADRVAVATLADTVHAEHGPLDILVNNAGVGMSARFLDMALEDWDWIVSINLMGAIHMCHAFGPRMVERGRGHVVNISSGLGYTPTGTEPGYGTTKAAVLAFSRSLRADWHTKGVGVSAICPGVINTPIISHTRFRGDQSDPDRVARVKDLFSKRGHPPELVAKAVLAAVRDNKSVVPVGVESRIGWYISRGAPVRFTDWMARLAARRV
ncbi:MAG: SDR family NAD(P)-dependent oxidoreductase [Acidimicrobiia bacterium]|nr:SDR family NAD(P)-dependent oxidoreductase [Acidimicrobiia bacterium]